MKPIIIIPTYNEIGNIKNIIEAIFETVNVSILVVDDNSVDGTKEEIEKLKSDKVFVLNRPSKLGLASAYIDGFKYAIEHNFDIFIQMDADFSHDPKYLSEMLELLKDYDVVIGSRNIKDGRVEGWGIIRNLISKGGSLYSRLILNCKIRDLTGGFNGWTKSALDKIDINSIISKGYSFQIEMKYKAYKSGLKIKEFPIIFKDRTKGKSKMNKAIFFEALLNVIKIR